MMNNEKELRFANNQEDLKELSNNKTFFEGLEELMSKFQAEVQAYGNEHKIGLNTSVLFQVSKD